MKIHYAHEEKPTETDSFPYYSDPICGLSPEEFKSTTNLSEITCKRCLKRMGLLPEELTIKN